MYLEIVRETFAAAEIVGTDSKKFTPHLTIAKTTKTSGRKRVKKIEPTSYEKHMDEIFGTQTIDSLELLSMKLPPDKLGYYHCFSRESFTSSNPMLKNSSKEIFLDGTSTVSNIVSTEHKDSLDTSVPASTELSLDASVPLDETNSVETTPISEASTFSTVLGSTEDISHTNKVSDGKDTSMVKTVTDHTNNNTTDITKNSKDCISESSLAGEGNSINMASAPFSAVRFTPRVLPVRKEASQSRQETADITTTDNQISKDDNNEEVEQK